MAIASRGRRCLLACVLALGATGSRAAAQPADSDEQRAAQAIERALQRHAPEVHRCFEQALADRLDVSGKLTVEVEIGAAGRLGKAKVGDRAEGVPPGLADCVAAAAERWTIDGIEAGAAVVLPFSFAPQAAQFVVKVADVPERGPAAPKGREPPFRVKVLADAANVRAREAALTLLTVGPASRVAMHRHPTTAKVLYVLQGVARLLGPPGTSPQRLDEGTAIFLPPGYPHVIENMGRQTPATMLQIFAPGGPERVYRAPADPAARAEFEVLRDPRAARAPAETRGRLAVRRAADVAPVPLPGGKGNVRVVLDPSVTGSGALAVDVLELDAGAELPRHDHPGSAELLYVVSGAGIVQVGREDHPFAAEHVIHIPAGQPHASRIDRAAPAIGIQIYAPAGPEQRFLHPAPAAPAASPQTSTKP